MVESLRFATDHSLKAAANAAGHQVVGVSLLPNGVVIDTKNLTAVVVDPDSETAYVEAGGLIAYKLSFCKYKTVHAVMTSIVGSTSTVPGAHGQGRHNTGLHISQLHSLQCLASTPAS